MSDSSNAVDRMNDLLEGRVPRMPSRRDEFAMAAMQGLLAGGLTRSGESGWIPILAERSVKIAEALLAELEKP